MPVMTLLMQAVFERNSDDAKLLLDQGADMNLGVQLEHGWWTPLTTAMHTSPSRTDLSTLSFVDFRMVRLLLLTIIWRWPNSLWLEGLM
jgi:hypothetical protein